MSQTIKFKSNGVRYYCPKCNRIYNDENHKRYLNLRLHEERGSYGFDHEIDTVPHDDIIGKCCECGSNVSYVDSIAMNTLVANMIVAGFEIIDIDDCFDINIDGFCNINYNQRGGISFKVPVLYKPEFNKNVEGNLLVKERDGIYYVIIVKPSDAYALASIVRKTAGDSKKLDWIHNYLPKIISSLVLKGYNVISAEFSDNDDQKMYGYNIALLENIGPCSAPEVGLYVNDNMIYFDYYRDYGKEYLEWVQRLPEYKES